MKKQMLTDMPKIKPFPTKDPAPPTHILKKSLISLIQITQSVFSPSKNLYVSLNKVTQSTVFIFLS